MNNEAKKAASGWDRVENGQAQPEHLELWDAINEVVAASGGSTSCTNVARQKAVVRVHQAVTAIVAASLARATAPHRGDICMVRVPEPEGGMEECSQTLPCPRHGMRTATEAEPSAEATAHEVKSGRAVVRELERWYFGCEFSQWKEKTQVGEWRDIVNEAGARIAKLRKERDALAAFVAEVRSLTAEFDGWQECDADQIEGQEDEVTIDHNHMLQRLQELHRRAGASR